MKRLSEKKRILFLNILLAGIMLTLFFLNGYNKTLFMRPSGPHQWRQCDCLSITKNYYEEGMHFFQPKVHYNGIPEGKAVSECPILNFSVAALWKIFGEHEFIYRLLEYIIYIIAIFIFFNTLLLHFQSGWISLFGVTLLLTSPLLTFYSFNFIADVPAFSLCLISFCLFYNFYKSKKISSFIYSVLFGTLAVLLKASALSAVALIYFFCTIDFFGLSKVFKTEKLFHTKLFPAIVLLLSICLILIWYNFAANYSSHEKNDIFLLNILPIWEMNQGEIIFNFKQLFNAHFPVFLSKPMIMLFLIMLLYVISNFKDLHSFLKYSFLVSVSFFVLYILFFFQVFSVHDYYLTNLMIFPIILFFCASFILFKRDFVRKQEVFLISSFLIIFCFNSIYSASEYRLRIIKDDALVSYYPFITSNEINLSKYLFWDYENNLKHVEELSPILRKHGIKREDFVISIPDNSFNISLYFMDQKGHGIAREHLELDSTVLEKIMKFPAKYIVMSDTILKKTRAFQRMKYKFDSSFYSNGVEVFKIK